MGAIETKQRILNTTMELINERGGDIDNVTIRMIADRAGIGVGLTNHYFKSKDLLVAECVDSIFKDVFAGFIAASREVGENAGPMEAAKKAAVRLVNFMFDNEAVARVALISDAKSPSGSDYTTRLVNSFAYCMVDRRKLEEMLSNDRMTDKMKQQFREHFVSEQRIKAFMIVSAIKEAFLRRDSLVKAIGVDLRDPDQCSEYLDELIEMLM